MYFQKHWLIPQRHPIPSERPRATPLESAISRTVPFVLNRRLSIALAGNNNPAGLLDFFPGKTHFRPPKTAEFRRYPRRPVFGRRRRTASCALASRPSAADLPICSKSGSLRLDSELGHCTERLGCCWSDVPRAVCGNACIFAGRQAYVWMCECVIDCGGFCAANNKIYSLFGGVVLWKQERRWPKSLIKWESSFVFWKFL